MNKYLIAGAGVLAVAVLVFVLLKAPAPSGTKTEATPSVQPTTQPTNERTVNVTKIGFEPETLKVKVGTKVVWTNRSGGTVIVNSAVHPTHLLYPFLNLGGFEDGSSVEATFKNKGTYKYHNHLNPDQTGTVIVE